MFNDKVILITGATGSFGKTFLKKTLSEFNPRKIILFSRDEMKQYELAKALTDERIRFFIGDIKDKDRLKRACQGVDYIVHAAALKIVPSAEYNPFEYVKTNVMGAMNLIDAAIDCSVKKVIALSTDKACNPVNLYGATKLCSDKLFIAGNSYSGVHNTKFVVVRYGNVLGSRGSVIPFFREHAKKGIIPITDERMTRFVITLDKAVNCVYKAFQEADMGEIFIPKIPSIKVVDIARAINPDFKVKVIGIRPGEKLHEVLITPEDSRSTYDFNDHYRIMPAIYSQSMALLERHHPECKKVPSEFVYSSDLNNEWLSVADMKEIIEAIV